MADKNMVLLHQDAFMGKTDYIPLAIKVCAEKLTDFGVWDCMRNPEKLVKQFILGNRDTLKLNSDWIPVIESNFLELLIPSLYGAKSYESPGGLIDIRTCFDDITDTERIGEVDLNGGEMENALKHLRYLMANRIEGVEVLMSRFMSPMDYAVTMRGGDFYLDLMLEPELCEAFLNHLADTTIKVMKLFKKELNESMDSQITLRGFSFPGIRITGDSIVNLSPELIRKFTFPIFKKFADEFGQVMLHYCTTPAPTGHVLPVLAECPYVKCVDNWQGYRTFFGPKETFMHQDKISICTDLNTEELIDLDKFFDEQPFYSKVPRKNGRGILATVYVQSLEEGQRLYYNWRNYFIKKGML